MLLDIIYIYSVLDIVYIACSWYYILHCVYCIGPGL